MEEADLIKNLPAQLDEIFPAFDKELKEELLLNADFITLKEGEFLMEPGNYIRSTAIVINGLLKVVREGEEGNEFLLYYLHPGDACALSIICMASKEKSEVSVVAVKETELLRIPADYSQKWISTYNSWYKFVIETYRLRFEEVLNTLDQVAFKALDERLVFFLKRYAKANQTDTISLTHAEIAKELNSSREVISRLLKKLEQNGVVELNRNYILLRKNVM